MPPVDPESVGLRIVAFVAFAALLAGATVGAYKLIEPPSVRGGVAATAVLQDLRVAPGDDVTFPVVLTNRGETALDVTFRVRDAQGLDVDPPGAMRLPAGGSAGTYVNVSTGGAASGDHTVVVEAVAGDEVLGTVRLRLRTSEPGATVQPGDVARIEYIARLPDGRVFGTNIAEVSASALPKHANLFRPPRTFEPFDVDTGPESTIIRGLRESVVGMGIGYTASHTVAPGDAFGNATVTEERDRVTEVNRTAEIDRVFEGRRSFFGGLINSSSEEGDVVMSGEGPDAWPFRITHLNDTHAELTLDYEEGDELTYYGAWPDAAVVTAVNATTTTVYVTPPQAEGENLTWFDHWPGYTVVEEITDEQVVLRHDPLPGTRWTEQGAQGRQTTYQVTELREDVVVVSRPNDQPLAGYTVIFDVRIVGVQ